MSETPVPREDEIKALLMGFIHDELAPANMRISASDDLLDGEILDSIAILRLATFADETFHIGMQPSDFQIENFRSVNALAAFVLRSVS
ncbi:MAG: hypothetical protein V2I57_09880 [Xanthomonadales bacterium]|jgi:acyl carrier protein|nr:hypothetical protein [Xanthomonadales bacterium]